MKTSCNLELELRLSSSSDECSSSSPHHQSSEDLQHQRQLTIFYNGAMCVCDVTELQARAIICAANNEIGNLVVKASTTPSSIPRCCYKLSSPSMHYSPPYSSRVPAGGLSMKKSLQKFLQKRNHRNQAPHPYR